MDIQQSMEHHELYKYYCQRYKLFSRFDQGILMDKESWYSVTPENIANHIAERIYRSLVPDEDHDDEEDDEHEHDHGDEYGLKHDNGKLAAPAAAAAASGRIVLIVDGFCGVGGNTIQFAKVSPNVRVIACDNCERRLRMAKHNAGIYGVSDQCEFILGDFMDVMRAIETPVDAVFLSPPWGGINYSDSDKYSLTFMQPNGFDLMQLCRRYLTNNIAFLMPRNVDIEEVKHRLLDECSQWLEVEQNMIGRKTKTITVYFGDLVYD